MSEPTNIFDEVKSRMDQVGGQAWIDELLIRGDATGIRGAHLVVGWSAPGVMGAIQSGVTNPQPLTMETGDSLWEALKTELNAVAIQQVIDQQQVISDLQGMLEIASQQIADLQAQLNNSTELNAT